MIGDFQAGRAGEDGSLGGFFFQDPVGDGNAQTSDGLFVFTGSSSAFDVAESQTVRVTGTVAEFMRAGQPGSLTQLANVTSVVVCSAPAAPVAPVVVQLPSESSTAFERFEGMAATFPQELSLTEYFNLDRFGEVLLAAGGPLVTPTEVFEPSTDPGSPRAQLAVQNRARSILLDDGRSAQNPIPAAFVTPDNPIRRFDTTENLTGILTFDFGVYRVQPTQTVEFEERNPRSAFASPQPVGGDVQVGSFNVLNYFTTFNPTGSQGQFGRGARNQDAFDRQEAKIVAAILGLGADVLGLQEIENTLGQGRPGGTGGAPDATNTLVNALNESDTVGTWAAVPLPSAFNGTSPGTTDAIRNALIYRSDLVSLVAGSERVLIDPAFDNARAPLAATFTTGAGDAFTVLSNHFKSKGSDDGTTGNTDIGDGQGRSNADRIAQAQALRNFIAALDDAEPDVVSVGDYNAYTMEDPLDVLRAAGLTGQA